MSHDDAWRLETQTRYRDAETYQWEHRIACTNCPNSDTDKGPLNGTRFWFEDEKFYVLIGCPEYASAHMAANGRWATNISKWWDQWWDNTETPRRAATIWGFTETDNNIYYVKGSRNDVFEALDDLERRLGEVMDSVSGYQCYGWSLVRCIKKALCALDPSWEDSEKKYREKWERDHAKDVVARYGNTLRHRDGTISTSYW